MSSAQLGLTSLNSALGGCARGSWQATRVGRGNAASSNDAIRDYQIVWGARHGGASDHVSIAVLAKDARGADPVGSSA
jgi:hypothetical protein